MRWYLALPFYCGLTLDRSPKNHRDRKSTRLNSSHGYISYAVFCLKKKTQKMEAADARSLFGPPAATIPTTLAAWRARMMLVQRGRDPVLATTVLTLPTALAPCLAH